MSAIKLIEAERSRQQDAEGWTPAHDDMHDHGELSLAAGCYAFAETRRKWRDVPADWPWDETWWKPCPDDRIRELVKAGALIAAEIERLQRAALAKQGGE